MKYAICVLLALLISLSSLLPAEVSAQSSSEAVRRTEEGTGKGKQYFLLDSITYDSLSPEDRVTLDSLLPAYHAAKHDTTRLNVLDALAENLNDETLWPRYNVLMFRLSDSLLKNPGSFNAQEIKRVKKHFAGSLQNTGYYLHNIVSDMARALEYYNKSLVLQKEVGDKRGEAFSMNNMAIIFQNQGDIPKALDYYFKSLKIQEEINDREGIGYALNNIGAVYITQGDSAKAIEYLADALKIREEIGDLRGQAYSIGNLGAIYRNQGNSDKALYYYRKGLALWEKLGQKQGIAYSIQNLGFVYQQMFDKLDPGKKNKNDTLYRFAMDYMGRALTMYEELDDKRGVSFLLGNMGTAYLSVREDGKALECGKRALGLAQEIGYPQAIRNASDLLYKVYRGLGKWQDALAMHELMVQMRDSLSNEETQKSTFKQQAKYEYETQQAIKDAQHQSELAISAEAKKRQQIVSYAIGGGLLMVLLFSIFIFSRLQIMRKQKLIIEQKNKHIADSINYAKRIQDAILPSGDEMRKSFPEHFIFFRPREIVSGDFFWFSRQGSKTILAVADCTGHGVPGAFMSMIGNTLLNEIVNGQKIIQPADILSHLNEGIVQALHQESRTQDDGMDLSLCVFDHDAHTLTFAGANRSLYIVDGKTFTKIDGDYFSIGSMFGKKTASFTQKEIPLQKNTSIFLSTDGYADQPGGEKGKKFMSKRFEELLLSVSMYEVHEQYDMLKTTFEEWKNTKQQVDDVLVLGIKYR